MPYLRLTCPQLEPERRRSIAETLTSAVVELSTPPRGPTADEIRAHTTVHFTCYGPDELFIAGRPADPGAPDVTVEFSDWSISVRQQRRVTARLTPLLVEIFSTQIDSVNMRFQSYPPTDFAVGGQLLADRIPRPARWAKRIFG